MPTQAFLATHSKPRYLEYKETVWCFERYDPTFPKAVKLGRNSTGRFESQLLT